MTITEPQTVPTRIIEPLLQLVECLCDELTVNGAGQPCWCGLYPGLEVAWDYCTDCDNAVCGMAYVRVVSVFPYQTFPAPFIDLNCKLPLAAQVEVGALRCMPVPVDAGPLDSAEAMEVSLRQMADAWAMWRAIQCCQGQFALGDYLPVGPQGACVGGLWNAFLAID